MGDRDDNVEFGRLARRTAVVTGASSGIGRAIALELAAAGADVLIHARARSEFAGEVADRVRSMGRRSGVVLVDLADGDQYRELVDEAWNWSADVDIWVNNAGADVLTGPRADWSFEQKLEYLWQVDVRATIGLSRLVGQRMRERARSELARGLEDGPPGRHCLLNLGWDQAEQGMGGDSGEMFAAVKAAVMAFTKSLARSLAPYVRVNCLAPGWIRTAWGETASAYWQERARDESLLGRWGTPEDVARAARFLASSAADFVTGQVWHVNGGHRARGDEWATGPDGE